MMPNTRLALFFAALTSATTLSQAHNDSIRMASAAVLWSGDLSVYNSPADIDSWSFSNQNNQYQSYIHGTNTPSSKWIQVSTDYASPYKLSSAQSRGVKISTDGTSSWNGQQMMRTEWIVEGKQYLRAWQQGVRFFAFSIKQDPQAKLDTSIEHQLVFFESHPVDLKLGWQGAGDSFSININKQLSWKTPTTAAEGWHNFVWKFDYSAKSVTVFYSLNGAQLAQVVGETKCNLTPDDLHIGMLKMTKGNGAKTSLLYTNIQVTDTMPSLSGATSSTTTTAPVATAPVASTPQPVSPPKSSVATSTGAGSVFSSPGSAAPTHTSTAPSAPIDDDDDADEDAADDDDDPAPSASSSSQSQPATQSQSQSQSPPSSQPTSTTTSNTAKTPALKGSLIQASSAEERATVQSLLPCVLTLILLSATFAQ